MFSFNFLKRKENNTDTGQLNRNIETINQHLYAVSFKLIPFIKDISYTPDDEIGAYQESMRLDSQNGILVLNKDHKGYELLKFTMLKAMRNKDDELKKQIEAFKAKKLKSSLEVFYENALVCEQERRKCLKPKAGVF